MNIRTGAESDVAHEKPTPGSYEWWYVDACDPDSGIGFVIIFYEGNPFSSSYIRHRREGRGDTPLAADYPALSVSIYRKGKPVYYGFVEHSRRDCDFDLRSTDVRVGESRLHLIEEGNEVLTSVHLDQSLPGGDSVKGSLQFRSPLWREPLTRSVSGNNRLVGRQTGHGWNLVQPRAAVKGELRLDGYCRETIRFTGIGYHDHNVGLEPMKESFSDWYWGRFHLENETLVYYIMRREQEIESNVWLIGSDGNVREAGRQVELDDRGINLFGLRSHRKITFEDVGVQGFIEHSVIVDNGPFYQRFLSRLILERRGEIRRAEGFSEYIHPDRIEWEVFRPLVDMRITYADRPPHWVQKYPKLYRWTW